MSGILLRSANGLARASCVLGGGIGNRVLDRLSPRQQVRVLRLLGTGIQRGMQTEAVTALYHRFRGHDEPYDGELFAPRAEGAAKSAVAVLFSGGKDCTCSSWRLAREFDTVHLLTLELDSTEGGERCEINVERLRRRGGSARFVHHYLDGAQLFDELHNGRRREHRRLFGSTAEGSACIVCHIVMQTQALAYCHEHGIRWMANGASPSSRYSYVQNIRGVRMVEAYLARYGVAYRAPMWETPFVDPVEELFREQVIPHRRLGKPLQYGPGEATQGFCPLGLWDTITCTRHVATRGLDDYLEVASNYRRHLEDECTEVLRGQGIEPI